MGRIEIERLGSSVIFVEGSTASALRRAAGHISGTASRGNPATSASLPTADSFPAPADVRANDVVVVTTLAGAFRYRVVSTRIVTPETVSVLEQGNGRDPDTGHLLPVYFVGEAPSRFIVRQSASA